MSFEVLLNHLCDRTHLHHLATAALLCAIEVTLIGVVDVFLVHLLFILGVFGRDAIKLLLSD